MKNRRLKDLYDCFYIPPDLPMQKQKIENCHEALMGGLDKSDRRLVLQISDAKGRMVEDISIDRFISGFELARQLSMELNHYKIERSVSRYTAWDWALISYSRGRNQNKKFTIMAAAVRSSVTMPSTLPFAPIGMSIG